jgi:hypothetical protein
VVTRQRANAAGKVRESLPQTVEGATIRKREKLQVF